jgi:desulfoferrodoxin (superoxide reductase-like protein)
MGNIFKKTYFPEGYTEFVEKTVDRLKYTNEEAKKNFVLKSIIKADIVDLILHHSCPDSKFTQEDFEKLEIGLKSLFDKISTPEDDDDAESDEDVGLPHPNLTEKFIDWIATAIEATTLRPTELSNTAESTTADVEWITTAIEATTLRPTELSNTAESTTADQSASQQLVMSKDEIFNSISTKYAEIFTNVERDQQLEQIIIEACADYWLQYQDCANSSLLMDYRRRQVSKHLEAAKLPVLAINNHYKFQEALIKTEGQSAWALARRDIRDIANSGVMLRACYDVLVGAKIAAIWLDLTQQSVDDLVSYFEINRPKDIEKMFFDAYEEYNLAEGPEDVIACYKHYCC